jgi:integrase/recombinase XerD
MMLEELQRRNYAETTIRSYIRIVKDFSRRFQRPPDRLGPEHIREYQSELFTKRKFAASTVTVYLAALRFFYTKTLKRVWSTTETPYPKRVSALPAVLSQEEVAQLIDAALTPFHRTLLMTLYATGVRRAELTRLKVTDIDSRRMVIHVQGGKGRKDRDVMLSPKLLDEFRKHWRRLGRKPSVWLFPGNRQVHHSLLLRNRSPGTGYGSTQHPDAVRPQLHISERHLNATASPLDSLLLKSELPQEEQMGRPPLEVADLVRGAGQAFIERS